MRALRKLIVVAAMAVLGSTGLAAQCTVTGIAGGTCTQNRNITATVRRTVRVVVTPTSVVLPTPSANDFTQGFQTAAGPTLTVQSNVNWQVTIRSTSTTFTASLGGRVGKPRADLLWGTNLAGPWTPVTGTVAPIGTGGATATGAPPLFYRVNWFWNLDRPGGYRIAVQLTVSST